MVSLEFNESDECTDDSHVALHPLSAADIPSNLHSQRTEKELPSIY